MKFYIERRVRYTHKKVTKCSLIIQTLIINCFIGVILGSDIQNPNNMLKNVINFSSLLHLYETVLNMLEKYKIFT